MNKEEAIKRLRKIFPYDNQPIIGEYVYYQPNYISIVTPLKYKVLNCINTCFGFKLELLNENTKEVFIDDLKEYSLSPIKAMLRASKIHLKISEQLKDLIILQLDSK